MGTVKTAFLVPLTQIFLDVIYAQTAKNAFQQQHAFQNNGILLKNSISHVMNATKNAQIVVIVQSALQILLLSIAINAMSVPIAVDAVLVFWANALNPNANL